MKKSDPRPCPRCEQQVEWGGKPPAPKPHGAARQGKETECVPPLGALASALESLGYKKP